MRETIFKLVEKDSEKYGVLLEICSCILERKEFEFPKLKSIEKGFYNNYKLSKDDDIYLGKIIYAANIFDDTCRNTTKFDLLKKAKNRYELVIATSKRARQIAEGAEVKTKVKEESPVTLAANEIAEGKVEIVEPDVEKEDRIERGEE